MTGIRIIVCGRGSCCGKGDLVGNMAASVLSGRGICATVETRANMGEGIDFLYGQDLIVTVSTADWSKGVETVINWVETKRREEGGHWL